MTILDATRQPLKQRILALIEAPEPGPRDALLLDLARWQARHVAPYRRLLSARGFDPDDLTAVDDPAELPAVPTDVFRAVRVAAHPEDLDVRHFLTSGTSQGAGRRGCHALRDLDLYNRAAERAASHAFFPDAQRPAPREAERMRLLLLVASEAEAPESSLGYMLARYVEWFGRPASTYAWHGTLGDPPQLDLDALTRALDGAERDDQPIALLGTSFAFVHAEDALQQRWQLPAGSRLLHTGGTKGRSRAVDPAILRSQLSVRFGIPETHIVTEYGMTELTSQLYETTLRDAVSGTEPRPRRLWAPGWLRVSVVDPVTLRPVPAREVGLVRIDDPANLDTAWAIQTSDLGRYHPSDDPSAGTLELLGRAPGAVPRGCSLAVEAILNGQG